MILRCARFVFRSFCFRGQAKTPGCLNGLLSRGKKGERESCLSVLFDNYRRIFPLISCTFYTGYKMTYEDTLNRFSGGSRFAVATCQGSPLLSGQRSVNREERHVVPLVPESRRTVRRSDKRRKVYFEI